MEQVFLSGVRKNDTRTWDEWITSSHSVGQRGMDACGIVFIIWKESKESWGEVVDSFNLPGCP